MKTPKKISFSVPAVPVAQPRQRHRSFQSQSGRIITQNYTPKTHPVNAYKATLQAALKSVYSGPPIDAPLQVDMVFVMPRPKNKVWKTKPMPRYPHTAKPDRDNLMKSTEDALNNLLWRDDSLIYDGNTEKWVAAGDEQPHVQITVKVMQ